MADETGQHADDIAYLTSLVRAHDRPRYYATLFAPAAVRADLFALYGFAAEIARIPDLVSEPGLGEIRLKWWQEALSTAAHAPEAGDTPAVRALGATIAAHRLPIGVFGALIEARSFDLYSDHPPTMTDLEGRLGETESALFRIASIIMDAPADTAEASGHAGIAYGVARRLASFASDRARGRTILPADLLAANGISSDTVFAPAPRPDVAKAVAELARAGRRHLQEAQRCAARMPPQARTAFLPLAVAGPLLSRVERMGPELLSRPAALSDLEALARIGWARLRG